MGRLSPLDNISLKTITTTTDKHSIYHTAKANKPKIIVCQNSTFWLRLYVSSHTFSKSLGGIFASFLLVKLVKKLGNLSDFGKSMSLFARKSETDIQKQTVRI